jgi:rhomboid protease GluP
MIEAVCTRCGRPLDDVTAGPLCDTCAHAISPHAPHTNRVPDERVEAEPSETAEQAQVRFVFRPWVTYALVGINAAVYVAMVLSGASATQPTPDQLIRWGADFGPRTLTSEPWRMVTAAFVHIGIYHIFFNMWALVSLGALAEAIYKKATYFFMYLLSGIGGSILSAFVYPITVSAGASGAIFGIVGALIATFALGRLHLPPKVVKSQLTTLVVVAVFNLAYGAAVPGLNNAAHMGGLITGGLMGAIIAITVRKGVEYRRARNITITVAVVILLVGYFSVRQLKAFTVSLGEGRESLSRGDFATARKQLEEATRRDPSDAVAFAYLGTAYTRLGDMPSAEAAFRRSVELNPRDLSTRFQLAVVYFTEHKFDDAASTVRQLIEIQPNDPELHEFLAQVLAAQGSKDEAQQEHAKAMTLVHQQRQH